jgi:Na+-translocating ferredoxin:NAD+ oxidoreductase RnfD subunit
VLKAAVLLLGLAFVLHRLLPRRRMPWSIPLVVVAVLVTVRTVTWLAGD